MHENTNILINYKADISFLNPCMYIYTYTMTDYKIQKYCYKYIKSGKINPTYENKLNFYLRSQPEGVACCASHLKLLPTSNITQMKGGAHYDERSVQSLLTYLRSAMNKKIL